MAEPALALRQHGQHSPSQGLLSRARRKSSLLGKGCLKPSRKCVGECSHPQLPAPHPAQGGAARWCPGWGGAGSPGQGAGAPAAALDQPRSAQCLTTARQLPHRPDSSRTGVWSRGRKSPVFFYTTCAVGLRLCLNLEACRVRPVCLLRVTSVRAGGERVSAPVGLGVNLRRVSRDGGT